MKKYTQHRNELIKMTLLLTDKVYQDDQEMLSSVKRLCHVLESAEESEDFVNDILAFIEYGQNKNLPDSTILTTIIHDMGEFSRNRFEDWFQPRSYGYSNLPSKLKSQC